MTPDQRWKPGDRVVVRLPDKRRQSGLRGGGSRDIDVSGTVRATDLPGQPPGVQVDLDEEVNGVRDCYATPAELRPEVPPAARPSAPTTPPRRTK
jgi:hypothetical protein